MNETELGHRYISHTHTHTHTHTLSLVMDGNDTRNHSSPGLDWLPPLIPLRVYTIYGVTPLPFSLH